MTSRLSQAVHDRAKLLSRWHPQYAVADILRLHPTTITRMKNRGWTVGSDSRQPPVPSDWQLYARHMKNSELCEHYGRDKATIRRWLIEQPVRPPFKPGPRARA